MTARTYNAAFRIAFVAALAILFAIPVLRGTDRQAHAQSAAGNAPEALPKGRLTFDFVNWIRHETEAIVEVTLSSNEFRRAATGKYGWRHPDGDLIRLQGCGRYVTRLVIDRPSGDSEIVSPCSSEIKTISAGKPQFEFARLSPDKKTIAAELKYYNNSAWQYTVVVLEAGEIIAHFDNYVSPAWLPDGRLILSSDGLYLTTIEGKPRRIDDGWLGVGVVNPDVSPDGKIIAFEYNERLWVMDIDGKEYKEIMSGPARYRFPAWSPDGDFVAFLTVAGSAHSEVDRALHFLNVREGTLQRFDLSAFGGPLNHVPFGPLSWTR